MSNELNCSFLISIFSDLLISGAWSSSAYANKESPSALLFEEGIFIKSS